MTHSLSCRLLSSFLILELVLQTVLPSLRPEVLEARADDRGHSHGALVVNLSERLEAFEHLCVKDGEVFKGTVVDHDEQGGVYRLDCQAMARTLLSELDYARVQGASPNGCVVPPSGIDDFGRYLKEFEKLQNKIACQNPQGLEACVADVACNLFRSAPVVGQLSGLITGIFVKGNDAGSRAVQGCFGNQNSSCITEFIVGMVKDLLSNVTAIFDLAGMVWDKTKEIAVAAWKKFLGLIHGPGGVENKTTTAGLVASGQSDESIRQAKSDQQNWLRSLVSRLYDSIIDSILTDYACQKWSGPPHGLNSKCLEPVTRETWACASCNAKLNAVCGVLGVVGGEVLLAFFTGAA